MNKTIEVEALSYLELKRSVDSLTTAIEDGSKQVLIQQLMLERLQTELDKLPKPDLKNIEEQTNPPENLDKCKCGKSKLKTEDLCSVCKVPEPTAV